MFLPRVQKTEQMSQVQIIEKMVDDSVLMRTSPTANSRDASDSGSGKATEWWTLQLCNQQHRDIC